KGQQPQCNTWSNLAAPLLDFLMRMVLTAEGTEFLHLQPFRGRLLVLHASVVFTLALGALKCDVFARHDCSPLFDDFRNRARAHGSSAFADSETQTFIHGDGRNQLNFELDVIARHHHFHAGRELSHAGHVRGAEVELRTVALEKRRVTAALVLAQHVNFALELFVRLDRTRLRDDLAALDVVFFNSAQQQSHVVARTAFVQQFLEHLDAGDYRFAGIAETYDFHFLADLADALLDTAGNYSTAALDRENVLDWHQERTVNHALRHGNILVDGFHQLVHRLFPLRFAVESAQG